MSNKLRIIVTGLVGLYPLGGVAWDYFQYVTGLARLGHDVFYHEDTWSWPYDPIKNRNTEDGDYSAKFIADFFRIYAPYLSDKWHYLHLHERSFGMSRSAFDEIAKTADLFINVSGNCFIPDHLSPRCVKIFLDTDPGYNQIMLAKRLDWSENVERWCEIVRAHDRHFTNAENIHGPDSLVPSAGFEWQVTGRPIDLRLWEGHSAHNPSSRMAPWTTILTWNAFKGKLIYEGVEYKSKDEEFEKIIELPRHVRSPFKIAVGGTSAPLKRLESYGWEVVDAPFATLTPMIYQDFLRNSCGEFSTAKNVYVAMRTGWFSYRSACYLAAGRPIVVQNTGFASVLRVGEGIVAFENMEEAIDAIGEVEGNYERHAKAAREIAEARFDSDKILNKLIDDAFGRDA